MPLSTIDVAVTSRYLSALESDRIEASKMLSGPGLSKVTEGQDAIVTQLREGFHVAMIVAYAQGMSMLHKAGKEYNYGLDMEAVARIWRGGCIIRATLLEDMRKAYSAKPDLANLLLDPAIGGLVNSKVDSLRAIVRLAIANGIPTACLSAAMAYFDAFRTASLPNNLTQAQRDYFGAHTYERIDEPGIFHSHWAPTQE